MMTGVEFDALKADIAMNGLLEPIWLHPDGRIIDGRNRYQACRELGREPSFRTYTGQLDDAALVQFVVSLNLKRRHLDSGQKAFVALAVERVLAVTGRQQMAAGGFVVADKRQGSEIFQNPITETPLYSAGQAAAIVGTNHHYVHDAKRISEQAPDLAQAVIRGDMKITEARRQLQRRTVQEAQPLPAAKYRVVYADPPWQYSNNGAILNDKYGAAERHYPTMSLTELCSLDVRGLCEDDAVLFLWATSPMLPSALDVMRAWGFQYKTSFVWDKVKHNFGHYNSVRHELLLIGTRGMCTPDNLVLHDSVQVIERTEHSVKPEEFRKIIDALYTRGRRVELFARRLVDGWDTWGNENGATKSV